MCTALYWLLFAVIRYHDKKQLKKGGFTLCSWVSRKSPSWQGREGSKQPEKEAQGSHLQWKIQSREDKLEAGQSCTPSESSPNDVLLPARLYLPRFHNLS